MKGFVFVPAALGAALLAGCASLLGADFDQPGALDLDDAGARDNDGSTTDRGDAGGASDATNDAPTAPDDAGHCAADRKLCDGACVSREDPAYGCGASSCESCSVAEGQLAICSSGACGTNGCSGAYHLCGTDCVSRTSTYNCGTSCAECVVPWNAVGPPTCDGTACGFECPPGDSPCGIGCFLSGSCTVGTKVVFVTSVQYQSTLGGLAGADTKCNERAGAANLTGTFKAWLSDDTTAALNRMTHSTSPYTLVDGTVLATSFAGLLEYGGLQHAPDLTENGGLVPSDVLPTALCGVSSSDGTAAVWTNTTWQGTPGAGSCGNWGTPAGNSSSGGDALRKEGWSDACSMMGNGCAPFLARLFCVQQ